MSARIEHHVGEGNTSAEARPVEIVLQHVQTLSADGRSAAIALSTDKWHAANATVEVQTDSAVKITGSLLGVAILVTPTGPGQDEPVNAIVDPVTAKTAQRWHRRGGDQQRHRSPPPGRSRQTVSRSGWQIRDRRRRHPAAGPRPVVARRRNLQRVVARQRLGGARAIVGRGARQVRLSQIDVDRRSVRQQALATDPLSVVTLLILTASAIVAVLLGACAVLFGAAADATDDRPLLRMLALERVEGRRLVAMIAGKTLAVILLAIPLGLVAGRWLLGIATRLVAVSATSGRPNPALRLSVPWAIVVPLSFTLLVLLTGGALPERCLLTVYRPKTSCGAPRDGTATCG